MASTFRCEKGPTLLFVHKCYLLVSVCLHYCNQLIFQIHKLHNTQYNYTHFTLFTEYRKIPPPYRLVCRGTCELRDITSTFTLKLTWSFWESSSARASVMTLIVDWTTQPLGTPETNRNPSSLISYCQISSVCDGRLRLFGVLSFPE